MQDFEKLGAFYLGKRFDQAAGSLTDELILYDSGDLTTHAVIIGMTGSGKTGLGIDLIEEAVSGGFGRRRRLSGFRRIPGQSSRRRLPAEIPPGPKHGRPG